MFDATVTLTVIRFTLVFCAIACFAVAVFGVCDDCGQRHPEHAKFALKRFFGLD